MGSYVTIRPVKLPDDVFDIRELVERNADDLNIPEYAVERRTLEFLRSSFGPDEFLVADRGGLVGFIIIHRGRSFGSSDTANLRLLVDKHHREQGIGGQLVDAALAWIDHHTLIERVEATPYAERPHYLREDTPALQLWLRRGFGIEGIKSDGARLLDGSRAHVVMLARRRQR